MIDSLFDLCVFILEYCSSLLGMTYKELNVYLFVFIHPIITIILFIWLIRVKVKLKQLELKKAQ